MRPPAPGCLSRPTRRAAAAAFFIVATIFNAAPAASADDGGRSLVAPPETTLERPAHCEAKAASKRPWPASYPVCQDQIAKLNALAVRASDERKLLLIEFGARWCPWCGVLQRALSGKDPKRSTPELSRVSAGFVIARVGVSDIDGGRPAIVAEGQHILDQIMAGKPTATLRAYPLIAVLDPQDRKRIAIRNIDDLQVMRDKRFDPDRLATALSEMAAFVRGQGPEPREPSRIWRKLLQWWNS